MCGGRWCRWRKSLRAVWRGEASPAAMEVLEIAAGVRVGLAAGGGGGDCAAADAARRPARRPATRRRIAGASSSENYSRELARLCGGGLWGQLHRWGGLLPDAVGPMPARLILLRQWEELGANVRSVQFTSSKCLFLWVLGFTTLQRAQFLMSGEGDQGGMVDVLLRRSIITFERVTGTPWRLAG